MCKKIFRLLLQNVVLKIQNTASTLPNFRETTVHMLIKCENMNDSHDTCITTRTNHSPLFDKYMYHHIQGLELIQSQRDADMFNPLPLYPRDADMYNLLPLCPQDADM